MKIEDIRALRYGGARLAGVLERTPGWEQMTLIELKRIPNLGPRLLDLLLTVHEPKGGSIPADLAKKLISLGWTPPPGFSL